MDANTKRRHPDHLADSCKNSTVNWMAAELKFDHFCLYLPEALTNIKVKILLNETTWFLFEVNR